MSKRQASSLEWKYREGEDAPLFPEKDLVDGRRTVWLLIESLPNARFNIRGIFTRPNYASGWLQSLEKSAKDSGVEAKFFIEKTETNHLYVGRVL